MEQAIAAVTNLCSQWSALCEARPNELDLKRIGLDASAEALKELMQGWVETLTLIAGKARRLDPTEGALANAQLTKWADELRAIVANAQNQGVAWLVGQPAFLDRLISISEIISLLAARRAEVAKRLAKQLSEESVENASKLFEAAPLAEALLQKSGDVSNALDQVTQKQSRMEQELQKWSETASGFEGVKQEVESAQSNVVGRAAEVEQLFKDVVGFRTQAETKAGELDQRVAGLTSNVETANEEVRKALASLEAALIDARKQGLAGAFTERGNKIKGERRTWTLAFSGAVLVLLVLAIVFASDLRTFTYQALLVNLMRRLAVAAPMVWIGWYAAKQIGRLGRIQEDYEYKAATALAFQSYKAEVNTVGSDVLMSELLQRAIATFGENPVRLYGSDHHDPVSPVSELIKQLERDDSFKVLKKIVEVVK